MSQKDVLCIGIDLGTTNSVMTYIDKNGLPQIIPNEEGGFLTPSVVYREKDETGQITHIVGEDAVFYSNIWPEQAVRSIKRHMGTDKTMKIFDENIFTPEEVSGLILGKLKNDAEQYFQREVTHAVITVPAYFKAKERISTLKAAELAGWQSKNVSIINEPDAIFKFFFMGLNHRKMELYDGKKVLIFDLGGGKFELTIFQYEKYNSNLGFFHKITQVSDGKLGGDDFDEKIFQWVRDEHYQEHGVDIRQDPYLKAEVMKSVQKAKISLSDKKRRRILVVCEPPVDLILTRDKFDELCEEFYLKVENMMDTALEWKDMAFPSPIKPSEISHLILLGGSRRIYGLFKRVDRKFPHARKPSGLTDFFVAYGAAIYSSLYFQENEKMIKLSNKAQSTSNGMVRTINYQTVDEQGESALMTIWDSYADNPQPKIIINSQLDNQKSFIIRFYDEFLLDGLHSEMKYQLLLDDLPQKPAGYLKLEISAEVSENVIVKYVLKYEGKELRKGCISLYGPKWPENYSQGTFTDHLIFK